MANNLGGLLQRMNDIAAHYDAINKWARRTPEQGWAETVRTQPAPKPPYSVPPYVFVKPLFDMDGDRFDREVLALYKQRTKAPQFARSRFRPIPRDTPREEIAFVGPTANMTSLALAQKTIDIQIAMEEALDYPSNLTPEQLASLTDHPSDTARVPNLKERIAASLEKKRLRELQEGEAASELDENRMPSCFEIEELRRQARDYFQRAIRDPLDRDQDLLAMSESLDERAAKLEERNPYCKGFWVTLPSKPEKMVLFNPKGRHPFRVGDKSPGRALKTGDMIVLKPGDFIPEYSALPQPKESEETGHISLYVKWSLHYILHWDNRAQSSLHTPMSLRMTLDEAIELQMLDRAEWDYLAFTYPDIVKDTIRRKPGFTLPDSLLNKSLIDQPKLNSETEIDQFIAKKKFSEEDKKLAKIIAFAIRSIQVPKGLENDILLRLAHENALQKYFELRLGDLVRNIDGKVALYERQFEALKISDEITEFREVHLISARHLGTEIGKIVAKQAGSNSPKFLRTYEKIVDELLDKAGDVDYSGLTANEKFHLLDIERKSQVIGKIFEELPELRVDSKALKFMASVSEAQKVLAIIEIATSIFKVVTAQNKSREFLNQAVKLSVDSLCGQIAAFGAQSVLARMAISDRRLWILTALIAMASSAVCSFVTSNELEKAFDQNGWVWKTRPSTRTSGL